MKQKLKKLVKNPGIFFRDFLVKKYPIINCEQKYCENEEHAVYMTEQKIWEIGSKINIKNSFEVDIVYTWVNDKDPIWLKKRQKYINHELACEGSNNKARFEDHNELYYSILSVKKYLPWVRNIYIVTDDQIPVWLGNDKQIHIVNHKEIIDEKYLPTFNSHVIEANIHKINGLSEHFIYFNDDVMVARPLEKGHFFRKNGLTSIFVSLKSLKIMQEKGIVTATLQASKNSNQILNKKFGHIIDSPLVHTYVPLKKSSFIKYWNENKELIEPFLNNKYRGKNDLNMATFLIPWSMYLNGESVVTSEICYYFNIRSPHAIRQYEKLLHAKMYKTAPHSFCVNDFKTENSNVENFEEKLTKFLKKYYL